MGAVVGAKANVPAPFLTMDAVESALKFAAENVVPEATSSVTLAEAGITSETFPPKAQFAVVASVPPLKVYVQGELAEAKLPPKVTVPPLCAIVLLCDEFPPRTVNPFPKTSEPPET